MKREERLPELLSPAGSPEAFYAAVEAGADAVYLGVADSDFHARVGARNLTHAELSSLIPYAHAHGVRVYVTMNTLQFDRELSAFEEEVATLRALGADALIVADVGCMRRIAARFPDVEMHASTQAFAHNTATADALAALGCSRVVLARETRLADLTRTVAEARAEIEVFLHGALCVSHSGQCLFSSLVGGRSGNRGACAQPCRLPYSGSYPLSLKDLCLASHLPALVSSGVASLKIEGRMKSADYVFGVTEIYRHLLDEGRAATADEIDRLARLFSRDGFTDGYLTGRIDRRMLGVRRERDKAESRAAAHRAFSPLSAPIRGEATVTGNAPFSLSLSLTPPDRTGGRYPTRTVAVTGAPPEAAKNAALTREGLSERLCRMGDTPFSLSDEALALRTEDGLFMPVGLLNAHRRAATDALTEACRAPLRREGEPNKTCGHLKNAQDTPISWLSAPKSAVFYSPDVYRAVDTSFFDICFLPLGSVASGAVTAQGVLLPAVIMEQEWARVLAMAKEASRLGARYALVSSLGAVALAEEAGLIPFGDFRMNVLNRQTLAALKARGLCGVVLSPELPPAAARDTDASYLVYGRIPLMVTERCFVKDAFGCDMCGKAALTDRMGVSFPVLCEPEHRSLILNSLPTYLGDLPRVRTELARLGAHFIFTDESAERVREVVNAYRAGRSITGQVRRAAAFPKKRER